MKIEQTLTNELQLGQQLNNSVVTDRANFALLLALMSSDVEDQAQFHLEANAKSLDTTFEVALRLQLEVPQLQALVADEQGEQQSLTTGRLASEYDLLDARLRHCIKPEPLSFELGKKHGIASDIFDNIELVAAKKFSREYQQVTLEQLIPDNIIAMQKNYAAQLI